jgi:hypothetical protein
MTGAWFVSPTFTTAYETELRPSWVASSATTYVPAFEKDTDGVRPLASSKLPSPSRSHPVESTAPDDEPASWTVPPSPAVYGPPAATAGCVSGILPPSIVVTMSFHLAYDASSAAAVSACAARDSSSAASRLAVSTLEPSLLA